MSWHPYLRTPAQYLAKAKGGGADMAHLVLYGGRRFKKKLSGWEDF